MRTAGLCSHSQSQPSVRAVLKTTTGRTREIGGVTDKNLRPKWLSLMAIYYWVCKEW